MNCNCLLLDRTLQFKRMHKNGLVSKVRSSSFQTSIEDGPRRRHKGTAMTKHVFSDYSGDRLVLMKAKRERTAGVSSIPTAEEAALRAGRDGEEAVVQRLAGQCEEPFSLVTGYHSWHGEIDVLLITPTMVAAIEVKTLNAEIAIDGDVWVRRRRSVDGRPQEEWYAIEDEGSRSPSQQLNQAALPPGFVALRSRAQGFAS